jgi:hypothetical protein
MEKPSPQNTKPLCQRQGLCFWGSESPLKNYDALAVLKDKIVGFLRKDDNPLEILFQS